MASNNLKMEKYKLPNDIPVFGFVVKTFPNDIGEAFDKLMKMLPPGDPRPYYGISQCTKEGIQYKAAALETFEGEAAQRGCESYIIEKGEYLAVTIMNWHDKTDRIKEVFKEIGMDARADGSKPFVEIYKNMEEMMCMVKIDPVKEIESKFEVVTNKLLELFSSFKQEQINKPPFQGSWTAAQVAEHLNLSDTRMLLMLNGKVNPTKRQPDQKIEQIKADFLDFSVKFDSSELVVPPDITYEKEKLMTSFLNNRTRIKKAIQTSDLSETCSAFSFPVYGELTRLELVHFIIYHTDRHIHQLKNIAKALHEEGSVILPVADERSLEKQ